MSDIKIGTALVHEVCPICGKPMNKSIIINQKLTAKEAKKVEDLNGKAIGISRNACEDCLKFKDTAVFCIAIDKEKSELNNFYRTGRISGISKNFKLFTEHPESIITTENGVSYCFMSEEFGECIGIFK
nr:MAG TPA: hypothetical protein [Crassvirales sp.]